MEAINHLQSLNLKGEETMTYKYYLFLFHREDCMESYVDYLKRYTPLYRMMNTKTQKQYADQSYGFRFVQHF